MDKEKLRKADFKTGVLLIAFCMWFLSITFIFMPFKETYGGVENVWYVSPWIFPAVVLTLLLILSSILTVNAVLRQGMSDVVHFPGEGVGSFRLTPIGAAMNGLLVLGSGAGLVYLIVNIQKKIQFTIDESKWLADPSKADIFSWSDPLAVVPLIATVLVLIASLALFATLFMKRHQADGTIAQSGITEPSERSVRFAIIAILFCELVYIFVPNIDFFVGILLFLTVFTVAFYVEEMAVVRVSMATYLAIGGVALLVFLTGLDGVINGAYKYTTDLLFLVATVVYTLWIWRMLGDDAEAKKKLRTCLIISWVTPLVLVPVFRFGLLVPLPHEGGVIELMHQLRYLLN